MLIYHFSYGVPRAMTQSMLPCLPCGVNRIMPRAFLIDLSSDQTCDNLASSAHTIKTDMSRKLRRLGNKQYSASIFSLNHFALFKHVCQEFPRVGTQSYTGCSGLILSFLKNCIPFHDRSPNLSRCYQTAAGLSVHCWPQHVPIRA